MQSYLKTQKRFVNLLRQTDKEVQKNQDFFVALTLRQLVPNYTKRHSVHLTPTESSKRKINFYRVEGLKK